MIRLEDLRNNVQDWIENEDDSTAVDRAINRAIRQVQKLADWEALRRIDVITPDEEGKFTQPPLVEKLRGVYSQGTYTPASEFVVVKEPIVTDAGTTVSGKLIPYGPTLTATETDLIVGVTVGSTTITQSATSTVDIDEDWVGLRFQLEGDSTTYEIASATAATSMTVYPSVRRDTGTTLTCVVDPAGQKQYKIMYYNGEPYTSEVDVYYQMAHPALNDDEDLLLIPAEMLVTLYAVQFFLNQTKYDVDARSLELAINNAKRDELAQEPSVTHEVQRRDNLFQVRSRTQTRAR